MDLDTVRTLQSMRIGGMTVKDIREATGICETTIRGELRSVEKLLPQKPKSDFHALSLAEIDELKKTYNNKQLAAIYGLHPSTIGTIIQKKIAEHNIKMPKKTLCKKDCMTCKRPFTSEGKHHRICNKCKDEHTEDLEPFYG